MSDRGQCLRRFDTDQYRCHEIRPEQIVLLRARRSEGTHIVRSFVGHVNEDRDMNISACVDTDSRLLAVRGSVSRVGKHLIKIEVHRAPSARTQ